MTAVNIVSSSLQDQSFLLFLDDMWDSFDLATVGLPTTIGPLHEVVFTTRDESICTEMGCVANAIGMRCLGENDAWNLFYGIIDSHPAIENLAKEV